MSNKKKSLLQEGTIRRFMKLAEIESLSENFLQDPDINEEEEMDIENELEVDDTGEDLDFEAEEGVEGSVELSDDEAETLVHALDAAENVADKLRDAIGDEGDEGEGGEEFEAELDVDEFSDEEGEEDEELGLTEKKKDKPYSAKKEKAGADKRKGAEKRGAEGTKAKTKGHGKDDFVKEDAEDKEDLNEMAIYEAALSSLDIEVDDDSLAQLQENVYKRVIARLLKEAKK